MSDGQWTSPIVKLVDVGSADFAAPVHVLLREEIAVQSLEIGQDLTLKCNKILYNVRFVCYRLNFTYGKSFVEFPHVDVFHGKSGFFQDNGRAISGTQEQLVDGILRDECELSQVGFGLDAQLFGLGFSRYNTSRCTVSLEIISPISKKNV